MVNHWNSKCNTETLRESLQGMLFGSIQQTVIMYLLWARHIENIGKTAATLDIRVICVKPYGNTGGVGVGLGVYVCVYVSVWWEMRIREFFIDEITFIVSLAKNFRHWLRLVGL